MSKKKKQKKRGDMQAVKATLAIDSPGNGLLATRETKKRRVSPSKKTTLAPTTPGGGLHALRETLESIVIAFVLAFLFRTFEAEAFVIPTGSMSPSLQGQHKDVSCTECGYRFRTTASTEGDERAKLIANGRNPALADTIAGVCPMCRQTMAFHLDLPGNVPAYINQQDAGPVATYPGDRILVNKYIYTDRDPDRWDVVVFKFPGNGEMNYIKRLVGLPEETLQIYQGDVFVRPDSDQDGAFKIERKPADKVRTMLQPVHDTDFDPSLLYSAGWPLRWETEDSPGWKIEAEVGEQTVKQIYLFDPPSDAAEDSVAWLRYRHRIPTDNDWLIAREFDRTGSYPGTSKQDWLSQIRPALIRDFNPYNARHKRKDVLLNGWPMKPDRLGKNWVSDLAVECHVEVVQSIGELYLDLVEGGKHFTCRIDLKTGRIGLIVDGQPEVLSLPTETTGVNLPGAHQLRFCNIDDQLLLWVDEKAVSFGQSSPGLQYDVEPLYGDRENVLPATGENDPGDLAPARVGARGAKLTIHRLQVLRDIYYVSVRSDQPGSRFQDFPFQDYPNESLRLDDGRRLPAPNNDYQLFTDPNTWPRFKKRRKQRFAIAADQLFVMGDNSPESQDCRLWAAAHPKTGAKPGGPYLDKRLLIGKAVCVFWPHSWGSIPGLQKLPGFPNFGDMRIVR